MARRAQCGATLQCDRLNVSIFINSLPQRLPGNACAGKVLPAFAQRAAVCADIQSEIIVNRSNVSISIADVQKPSISASRLNPRWRPCNVERAKESALPNKSRD